MAFLPVFETVANKTVVRVYRNDEAALLVDESEAASYVGELLNNYSELWGSLKNVVILWEKDGLRMADLWVFGRYESDNAGASVSVYLFKDLTRYESPEVTATDGLAVLGDEAREMSKK